MTTNGKKSAVCFGSIGPVCLESELCDDLMRSPAGAKSSYRWERSATRSGVNRNLRVCFSFFFFFLKRPQSVWRSQTELSAKKTTAAKKKKKSGGEGNILILECASTFFFPQYKQRGNAKKHPRGERVNRADKESERDPVRFPLLSSHAPATSIHSGVQMLFSLFSSSGTKKERRKKNNPKIPEKTA